MPTNIDLRQTPTFEVNNKKPGSHDPYAGYRLPFCFLWKGSVIPKVFPSAIICAIFAAAVVCVRELLKVDLGIPQTFVPVLGFVVGLLLTYRTNTAYDRYWEGRRSWSAMVVAIRNFARLVWVNVNEDDIKNQKTRVSRVLEKKTIVNLLAGFAVATMHYLREEEGTEYPDLKPLVSGIDSRLPGFQNLEEQERRRQSRLRMSSDKRAKDTPSVSHNFPLEITLYLNAYVRALVARKSIDPATTGAMYTYIASMTDCLTSFERILRTPIPLAYAIHLSQTVWLYCLSLPFQLLSLFPHHMGWIVIPVVFLVSTVLLGIEKIGEEIENPFGRDENDLDLDDFCRILHLELDLITSHPPPVIEDWVFTELNHPFGADGPHANDARKLSIDEVRSLLEKDEDNSQRTSVEVLDQSGYTVVKLN